MEFLFLLPLLALGLAVDAFSSDDKDDDDDHTPTNPGDDDDLTLTGTDEGDLLEGRSGDDTIMGGAGNDTLTGGRGDDQMDGGDGDDSLRGGPGDDTLIGGAHSDTIAGDSGNDLINGGDGEDWLYGGQGDDSIVTGNGDDIVWGGDGDDTITGATETQPGVSEGSDTVFAGAGNDVVDTMLGTSDREWIVNLGEGDDFYRGGISDEILSSSETVEGGLGNDTIMSFIAHGEGDADTSVLSGGEGDDLIVSAAGNVIELGAGADIIHLLLPSQDALLEDHRPLIVRDFVPGTDRLEIDANFSDDPEVVIESHGEESSIIKVDGVAAVVLRGVLPDEITAADIAFVARDVDGALVA